jgi:hypothetical protein
MQLTGLHVVLTYQCVFECGHCFIWGSPKRSGVFHLERLDAVLDQAAALGTVGELCYEGGETFVYYPNLIAAVRHATARRFRTSVVTNGYWANSVEQARMWLGRLTDAGLERVYFMVDSRQSGACDMETHPGLVAAQQMDLLTSVLEPVPSAGVEQPAGAPAGWPPFFCRRAAAEAEPEAPQYAWATFTACPYQELASPSHLHVDPSGDLHVCRELVIGNVFEQSLVELVACYDPQNHPVIGPLLAGGPAALVSHYELEPDADYGDACELCRHGQEMLRSRIPAIGGNGRQSVQDSTRKGGKPEPMAT